MSAQPPPQPAPPREFLHERAYPAPPEQLFRYFADPKLLARWWGPRGFSNVFEQFDLRPGGLWQLCMTGPDGARHHTAKRFVDVAPPHRITLDNLDPAHAFRLTITLQSEREGTRLLWSMRFEDPAEAERVGAIVIQANEENLDRLQELLGT